MWISEREGNTSTACDTFPHVPDEVPVNNHQASYLVSIRLIFVFIIASLVPCGKVRLQSNTDKQSKGCNTNAIHVSVNP